LVYLSHSALFFRHFRLAQTRKTVSENKSSEYPLAPAAVLNTEIKNIDGNVFKVADLKGKVLLLNLWATWCGPCREEMPQLVAMEDEFKAKDFKVIGLNIDNETPEKIQPFAERMKLNYELAWADENLYRGLLKVSKFDGIPQSFLLDREGRLRGVFLGGSQKVIRQMRENVEKVVNE
jgi:thiol-disulfide isomerase/thioredoxin